MSSSPEQAPPRLPGEPTAPLPLEEIDVPLYSFSGETDIPVWREHARQKMERWLRWIIALNFLFLAVFDSLAAFGTLLGLPQVGRWELSVTNTAFAGGSGILAVVVKLILSPYGK